MSVQSVVVGSVGRGGLAGGASSVDVFFVSGLLESMLAAVGELVSWASSSKSRGRAVVGDSGGASDVAFVVGA